MGLLLLLIPTNSNCFFLFLRQMLMKKLHNIAICISYFTHHNFCLKINPEDLLSKMSTEEKKYLGWGDAVKVEWKVAKEYEGRKNWKDRWGHGTPWMKRYNKWVCSGINRAMRKPSLRSLEWLQYQRGPEIAPDGEWRTRKRCGIKDYFIEPILSYRCCPCPWPITTSAEVGYLAQHDCCKLEIYPNDFMKKPPLPWYMPKIATFLANSQ